MVNEAEEHAEEDRKRREVVQLRNDSRASSSRSCPRRPFPSMAVTASRLEIKAGRSTRRSPRSTTFSRTTRELDRLSTRLRRACRLPEQGRRQHVRGRRRAVPGCADGFTGEEPAEDDATVDAEFREVGSDRSYAIRDNTKGAGHSPLLSSVPQWIIIPCFDTRHSKCRADRTKPFQGWW